MASRSSIRYLHICSKSIHKLKCIHLSYKARHRSRAIRLFQRSDAPPKTLKAGPGGTESDERMHALAPLKA